MNDPLTDPIPEDQTRLGTTALTLHELARAARKARVGTIYRSRRQLPAWVPGLSMVMILAGLGFLAFAAYLVAE